MRINQDFPIDDLGDVLEGFSIESNSSCLRSKAIRLLPNKKQRDILKQWFWIYADGYNLAVKHLRQHFRNNPEAQTPPSYYTFRQTIRSNLPSHLTLRINKYKIPMHTFNNAINDVLKNWKSANALKNKKHISNFLIRYIKRTKKKLSMVLEPSAFSKDHNIAKRRLGTMNSVNSELKTIRSQILRDKNGPKKRKDHECRLVWDLKTKHITLFVPLDRSLKETVFRDDWCSLDPGLRVFQTLYSPTSKADLGGKHTYKIKSILDRIKAKERFSNEPWFAKFKARKMRKISDIRDDMHWSIARKLAKSYNTVLLGSMSTKSICKRGGNLSKANKKLAYSLSHNKFRNKLAAKCKEYNTELIIVNEYLTSKTCGGCFKTYDCGSSKLFNCPRCPFVADRDLNGARNIAMKHFGLFNPIIMHRVRQ